MLYLPQILGILSLARRGAALTNCDCVYAVANTVEGEAPWVFTEAIESDFTRLQKITPNTGWQMQQFNVSAEAGRGSYGKAFSPQNVMPASVGGPRGQITREGSLGVDLVVGSTLVDGSVPVAEMDTVRQDILWGSFRAGMKLTNVGGTCAAFFWVRFAWRRTSFGTLLTSCCLQYFNDTQEIDMEFLSREYDHAQKIYPVNLVIQSRDSASSGYDASNTSTYKTVNLTFDPTTSFHEYRFDYLPGRAYFYADSELLAEMEGSAIPDSAGHLILQHWSNGNPKWSGGPPDEDATVTASYVKAYFNSSDAAKKDARRKQCKDVTTPHCPVPNVTAGNATTGGSFLTNATEGDGDKDSGAEGFGAYRLVVIISLLLGAQIFTWL